MIKLAHKSVLKSPSTLISNPKNVVEHPPEQIYSLVKLFHRFGFIGNVVVGTDNKILAGHGCTLAAMEAGMKKIPVIEISHLSEDEQDAFMIAHNKSSEMKLYDEDALEAEIQRLIGLDFSFAELGLEDAQLEIEINEDYPGYIPGEHEERKDGEPSPDDEFDHDEGREDEVEERLEAPEIKEPVEPKKAEARKTRCPNCSHEFAPVKRSCAA